VLRLKQLLGAATFWLFWPVWFLILNGSDRSRVIVEYGGKILLVRGWHDGKYQSLPGGGKEKRENMRQCAARELREEVGIEVAPDKLKSHGIYDHKRRGISFKMHLFSVSLTQEPKIEQGIVEIIDIQWIEASDISKASITEFTKKLILVWQNSRK
jgi:8-oxo-dGTP pyrophosphatase MutT (NUDIX family)